MKVGEVFLPDDQDFRQFKTDCTIDQGWTICYDKSGCRVATKKNSSSAFDVIRVNHLLDKTENFIYLFFSLRFDQNFRTSLVNYSTMLFMMVNIDQHGTLLCSNVMNSVLFYPIVI